MGDEMAGFDIDAFTAALEKASSNPRYAQALGKLMSEPIERVYDYEAHWISAGGTDELRVTLHPGNGYHEFMAALGA